MITHSEGMVYTCSRDSNTLSFWALKPVTILMDLVRLHSAVRQYAL